MTVAKQKIAFHVCIIKYWTDKGEIYNNLYLIINLLEAEELAEILTKKASY